MWFDFTHPVPFLRGRQKRSCRVLAWAKKLTKGNSITYSLHGFEYLAHKMLEERLLSVNVCDTMTFDVKVTMQHRQPSKGPSRIGTSDKSRSWSILQIYVYLPHAPRVSIYNPLSLPERHTKMSSHEPEQPSEPIRFRPSKKRKAFRQRADSEDESQTPEPRSARRRTAADYFDQPGEEDDEPTVVRAAARHTKRGFGFRAHARPAENEERGLVVRDEQKPVEDRFVKAASGRTVVDDRHMFVVPPPRAVIERRRLT